MAFDHVSAVGVEDNRYEHALGGDVSFQGRVLVVAERWEHLPALGGHGEPSSPGRPASSRRPDGSPGTRGPKREPARCRRFFSVSRHRGEQ